ncbi:MAG: aminoglycoside phosphotransferase family protein [Micromonosporaceae bacterium]|nr:aminoglycoside phosphotransferase family protein [Micromonosporaceae bacterium]
MTLAMTEALDLDSAARLLVDTKWGRRASAERVHVGVNKATWRVADCWLTCDVSRRAERVARMHRLLARLSAAPGLDIDVPAVIATREGEELVRYADRVWWLTRHVGGRQPDPRNMADTAAVASGLARLHGALRALPGDLAVVDDTLVSLFELATDLIASGRLTFSPDDMKHLSRAEAVAREWLPRLTAEDPQLIHGDPSNPNLRVCDEPVRLCGALDWDQARCDLVLADLATVAQTVVFRSGTTATGELLDTMTEAYTAAGGCHFTRHEVLAGLILVKFESIAHHGTRYLHGETDGALVTSQVDKIRTVLDLYESP